MKNRPKSNTAVGMRPAFVNNLSSEFPAAKYQSIYNNLLNLYALSILFFLVVLHSNGEAN